MTTMTKLTLNTFMQLSNDFETGEISGSDLLELIHDYFVDDSQPSDEDIIAAVWNEYGVPLTEVGQVEVNPYFLDEHKEIRWDVYANDTCYTVEI